MIESPITITPDTRFPGEKGVVVDVITLSKLTGYDRGTITEWITKHDMPTLAGGSAGIPYAISMRAFVEWRAERAAEEVRKKLPKGDFVGFMGITNPKESAATALAFAKMEEKAKNLVPRQFILDVLGRAFNTARVSIMSIPDRLYREKSGYPPEMTAKWREKAQGVCRDGLDAAALAVDKVMSEMLDADDEPA